MGGNYGKDVLYSVIGLCMNDIGDICKGLAAEVGMKTPTIDVDCSNVCYKVGKDAQSVANHLTKWAKIGVKVTPVCDGKRPISKQATNQREALREKNRIKAHIIRTEIVALQRKLKTESMTDTFRNNIREEVARKQRSMKAKETQSMNVVQPNYEEKLVHELEQTGAHSRNRAGGSVDCVMFAEFQADAVMMGRAIRNETLMVMTNDCDIPLTSGDSCIAIKQYTQEGVIEIVSTSRGTLAKALKYLSDDTKKRGVNITSAKHPIFEGVTDHKTRAIMELILGCDVCLKGLPGVGPKLLEDEININWPKVQERDSNATLFGYLKKFFYTKMKGYDNHVAHTYVRAIIYEPTNLVGHPKSYLGQAPTRLPTYVEEYGTEGSVETTDGPEIVLCKGVGARCHKFLAADGYINCKGCNEIICQHCRESIEKEVYCLQCYAAESLVPEADVEEGKSISAMRDELATTYGVEKAKELTVDEVEDLYALKEIATARIKKLFDGVQFPEHPSSEMDNDISDEWCTLFDINFGEGGAFISDPDLDPDHLPGILKLFAALVNFESKVQTDWVKDPLVYDAMPSMFIDFAKKSRIDTGYRLLGRCVRHAFDSRCKSLEDKTGSLVIDRDGNIGIRLGSSIPASMKKNIYETELVATAEKLLCCKCTCQCGSQGEERITCVHTLVVLYLLTVLLMEDLAEHILIALASRLNGSVEGDSSADDEDIHEMWMWKVGQWSDEELESMKTSVSILMEAAGDLDATKNMQKSLSELLQSFVVGTERRKEWKERTKLPPKPSELGPVKDMNFMSSARRAKLAVSRRPVDEHCTSKASNDDECVSPAVINVDSDTSAPTNPCSCSLPNCCVTESCALQSRVKCKSETCSLEVHRICQDELEATNNWEHCENEPYCLQCHPKKTNRKFTFSNAVFAPNYLKISGLMKAADCDMDNSDIIGYRLIERRCFDQMNGCTKKQKAADKEGKVDWARLKKLTEKRSVNHSESQLANLKKRSMNCDDQQTVEPHPTTDNNVVTPQRSRPTQPGAYVPQRKKRPKFIKCHKKGCSNHNNYEGMANFRRIPKFPAKLRSANPGRKQVINYYGRIVLRKEILRRLGLNENDTRRDLYVCLDHKFYQVVKGMQVKFPGQDKSEWRSYKLVVPEAEGPESNAKESTNSSGLGSDRGKAKIIEDLKKTVKEGEVSPDFSFEEIKEELESRTPTSAEEMVELAEEKAMLAEAESEHLRSELAREKLAQIQFWEQNSSEKVPINPSLKRALGMDVHIETPEFVTPTKFFKSTPQLPKKKKQCRNEKKERHEHANDSPRVDLSIRDDDVKRRTGFPSLEHLLSYVFIVCNGDIDVIAERRTVLTWFEEWFMHFEVKWGRTISRKKDIPDTDGPCERYCRRAIALKYNIERRAYNSWPTYVSYSEDMHLRDEKWDAKYGGIRPVMWDMTNIPAYGFTDADFNRITYSKYYAQNCFKGGVFAQLCGWIGTAELWTGAVSDTDYNKRAGYLQAQEKFQSADLVACEKDNVIKYEVIPFTNIYDKGYRAKMVAWRAGKQRVLQPVWAESDRRFAREDTLLTASVATDRGANERAVNVCKRSWFVSRGFLQNICPKQLNDAWTTWAFQCNFMFNPVL